MTATSPETAAPAPADGRNADTPAPEATTPEGAAIKLAINLLAKACVEGATVVDTLGSPLVGARIRRADGTEVPVVPNSAGAWRTTPSPMLEALTDELCAEGPLPPPPTVEHRNNGLHIFHGDGKHWHSTDQGVTWTLVTEQRPLPAGATWCPDPSCAAHADGPHVHPAYSAWQEYMANVGAAEEARPVPAWSPSGGIPPECLPVVSTWPAVVTTDLVVPGPDAARKIGAALDDLTEEANACEAGAPTTAEIIRETVDELRALLGLPRKT